MTKSPEKNELAILQKGRRLGRIRDEKTGKVEIHYGNLANLKSLFGTETTGAAASLLKAMSTSLLSEHEAFDVHDTAFIEELKPQNMIEATICVQMTATHAHAMRLFLLLEGNKNAKAIDAMTRSLARLQKTFIDQIEVFHRLRSGQTVQKQIVNIAEGGKAIVAGEVNYEKK